MQLTWPDELQSLLERHAAAAGFSSVDEFALRIFLSAGRAQFPALPWNEVLDAAELDADTVDAQLRDGLASGPADSMTPVDWQGIRDRVTTRLSGNGQ